jgi:hypothetical protein
VFRTAPVVESAPEVPAEPPVPLSLLALDLPEPPVGWVAYLNGPLCQRLAGRWIHSGL